MRKSNKAKRADKLNVRHAKDAAYCYTELCPDPVLRRAPGRRKR